MFEVFIKGTKPGEGKTYTANLIKSSLGKPVKVVESHTNDTWRSICYWCDQNKDGVLVWVYDNRDNPKNWPYDLKLYKKIHDNLQT